VGIFNFFRKKKRKKEWEAYNKNIFPTTREVEYDTTLKLEGIENSNQLYIRIDEIIWSNYETAYGVAEKMPYFLKALFSADNTLVKDATHFLCCSLCHQHAYISSAALPAYDFLIIALKGLNDEIKIELLDIFSGFSACTTAVYYENCKHEPLKWEIDLRQKLLSDVEFFKELSLSDNDDISYFAKEIVSDLSII